MKLRAREKRDKQLIASLPGVVRSLRRSTLDIDSRRAAHREAQRTALATRGLAGRRVGVARAPAERIDYQVGDELAEGLRTLKPEGNLWRDWQGSVTRRGKVEAPRLRTSEKRRAKTKTVEKHAWKRFE
jgi:nucleolar protein 53